MPHSSRGVFLDKPPPAVLPCVDAAGDAPCAPRGDQDFIDAGGAYVENRRIVVAEIRVGGIPDSFLMMPLAGEIIDVVVLFQIIGLFAELDGAVFRHDWFILPPLARVAHLEVAWIGDGVFDHEQRLVGLFGPDAEPFAEVLLFGPAEIVVQGIQFACLAAGVVVGGARRIE